MDIRRASCWGFVAISIAWTGCTSSSVNRELSAKSSGAARQTVGSPALDPRYDNLIREMETNGGQASVSVEKKTTTEQIGGALKKATATVGGALTIKPRVTKAPDPLALNNMPRKLGVDMYFQAGRLAESNGNVAAAIQQYERGLREDPKHVPTLLSLARVHDRQEEFHKAEKLYRQALDIDPENAVGHNHLGLCLARQGRTDEALASLRKAVELEPDRKLYRNNLATVLVDAGQSDAAKRELLAVHPAAAAHYNLGYLLYHAGRRDQAREEFITAERQDATLTAARDMLAQLDAEQPSAPAASLAQAQKASTKVRLRVEDSAPEPPGALGRTPAHPVSLQVTPGELRRTPPTATSIDDAAAPTDAPAEPDADPLFLYPGDAEPDWDAPASGPPLVPPTTALPPRNVSLALADACDEAELPTPETLLSPSGSDAR